MDIDKGEAFLKFGASSKHDSRVEVSWEAFSAGWDAAIEALATKEES